MGTEAMVRVERALAAGEMAYGYGATVEEAQRDLLANVAYRTGRALECDICGDEIVAGERFTDDGQEVTHNACVAQWFRGNFGRESLS